MNQEVIERMNTLEQKILVWACAYYRFDYNLVSDSLYDKRGIELMNLIKEYPNEFEKTKWYEEFYDYCEGDTPSAFNVNYTHPYIQSRAYHLVNLLKRESLEKNKEESDLSGKK